VPFVPSPADSNAKKKSRTGLWIILAVVVLGAGGGGGWWWKAQQADAHAASKAAKPQRAPAQYYALEPAFVVNLVDTDAVRYLQADVQLVTRDAGTRTAVETHAPAIRNHLLLLFGQQSVAQLSQRSGKERLQAAALAEVRQVLKHEAAPDKVEAVIFTSLVTQ
jgi:flagellar protein FliL